MGNALKTLIKFKYRTGFDEARASCTVHKQTIYAKRTSTTNKIIIY